MSAVATASVVAPVHTRLVVHSQRERQQAHASAMLFWHGPSGTASGGYEVLVDVHPPAADLPPMARYRGESSLPD